MSRDQETLLDIEHAARMIAEFVSGLDEDSFQADVKTQSAVIHRLVIPGEAAKRLSTELRQRETRIPWRLIEGMRDKLIHAYDEADLDEIWQTVQRDVPELLANLELLKGEAC